jgi:hypothetical protein
MGDGVTFPLGGEPVAQPGDIKFVNQTRASIEPKASLTHQM